MSKKTNPTLIGGFVVGAVVLLVAGAAIFGAAELFTERAAYVAYFKEQTKGLRTGSNVLMNGVRVGYVSDIALLVDDTDLEPTTRVTLEILPDTYIQTIDGRPVREGMRHEVSHDRLIHEAGLRAQLEIESFVTGQLLVVLDFRPDTEAILRGVDAPHPEVPTISSDIAQLLANFQGWLSEVRADVDFGEIAHRVESALVGLDELANSPDARDALAGLSELLNDPATQSMTRTIQSTLEELRSASEDAGSLFRSAEEDIDSLAGDLRPSLERLDSALREAEGALSAARIQLQGDSAQIYQLESTLHEVESAARSIQAFFDYLERNPEALLQGKSPE